MPGVSEWRRLLPHRASHGLCFLAGVIVATVTQVPCVDYQWYADMSVKTLKAITPKESVALQEGAALRNASGDIPLVSTIIPINKYTPRTIRSAIDSALGQTYPNVEVVVADMSQDDRFLNLDATYRNNSRVTVIHGAQPRGTFSGYTRNVAARAARGEYLAFLDADDVWLPRKLELQMRFAELFDSLDFSCTQMFSSPPSCRWNASTGEFIPWDTVDPASAGFKLWDAETFDLTYQKLFGNNKFLRGSRMPSFWDFEWIKKHNTMCTSTVILRKSVFDTVHGFRETIRRGQDYDLWKRIFSETSVKKVAYFPKALTIYDSCHGNERVKG